MGISLRFNEAQFNALSPFYFALNDSMRIEAMGTALSKICPDIRIGAQLEEVLKFTHPNSSFTFEELSASPGCLFTLEFRFRAIQVKGQFLFFPDDRRVLFVGTPSVHNIKGLAELGLTFQDFATHDSAVDYLFLLQSLQAALSDARRFSDVLATNAEKERLGLAKFPEESPHPILRIDKNGILIYANTPSQPILSHWNISVGDTLPAAWKEILVDGADKGSWEIEVGIECAEKVYLLSIVPISGANYINVYGRDVTIQKKVEADLEESRAQSIASAKMASLGEMAGGIAHEINSPLASITTLAGQLQELLAEDNVDLTYPKAAAIEIEKTAFRIAKIVNGLKAFSRESSGDPFAPVMVNQIFQDTLAFCAAKFKHHNIELVVDCIPDSLTVECRPSEIAQVILNLLNNARDAVENLRERKVWLIARDFEGQIELSVTDSGNGIPKEVEKKLFQPFFTTKEIGKGTGLGLGISKRIVEAHGGAISLDRQCSNTRFVVSIPKRQLSNVGRVKS